MKINYILIVLCFLMLESKAQISSYYYYQGQKIPLIINTGAFSITHTSDYETVKGLLERQGYQVSFLDRQTIVSTQESSTKRSILKIENVTLSEEAYNQTVQQLLANETVKSVQPVLGERQMGVSEFFHVKLKKHEDLELLEALAVSQGCKLIDRNRLNKYWHTIQTTKKSKNALELSNLFYETGIFEGVDPGFLFNFQPQCSEEPDFELQWALQNNADPDIDINMCDAWSFNKGEGVRIGVLDDGLENYAYPNLPSYEVHTEFQNTFIEGYYETQPYLTDMFDPNYDWNNRSNGQHGTGVLGIMAANHNKNEIAGVSPNSAYTLILNRINTSVSIDISQELAAGTNYAFDSNLDILLNEYGDDGVPNSIPYQLFQSEELDDAIENALDRGRNGLGTVMVFPVGNNQNISYPARTDPRIITVGAINAQGNINTSFGTGAELDLVAPGIDVLTTANNGGNTQYPSGTVTVTGTSFAGPYVAGVVALMLSENPCLTVEEVEQYLGETAQKIGNVPYNTVAGRPYGSWNSDYGYGLVDAYEAIFQSSDPIILQDKTEIGIVEYEKFGRIRTGNDVIPNNGITGDYEVNPGANVSLKAMKSIHLENGTKIKAGSTFRAYIKEFSGDCNDNWYARTIPNDDITVDGNATDKSNIGQETNIIDEMKIFPNPFSDVFNIKITNAKRADYELKILNIIGEVIYVENGNLDKGKQLLTIPFHHNNGVYFVQMRIGEMIITQKIMKHE